MTTPSPTEPQTFASGPSALPKDQASRPPTSKARDWPSPARAWTLIFILLIAYTSSFIDRQIMTLLVGPIRTDLSITVTEFSVLVGLAFSLFYSISGVPLAYLADRFNRIRIIMIGIAAWSIMTVLCGFAGSFAPLFLARMGVGIGEAALAPAAYSLISDSFPPERRGRAMGVYSMGAYFGAGLALVIGGAVIALIEHAEPVTLPIVGTLKAWQTTFLYVGLPGLFIVLALAFCREPKRQGSSSKPSLPTFIAFMREHASMFWPLTIGCSLFGIAAMAYIIWMPTILIREFSWTASNAGYVYGGIMLIFSTSGSFIGGWVADILTARGVKDAALRTLIWSIAASLPFAILTPFMPTDLTVTLMLAAVSFCFGLVQALPTTALHAVTPNQFRGQITAIYFVFGSIIAQGLGPTMVAALAEYGFGGDIQMGYAVMITNAVMLPLSIILLQYCRKGYCRSVDSMVLVNHA